MNAQLPPKAKQHRWDISPKEAIAIQYRLAGQVRSTGRPPSPELVAGFDIAFDKRAGRIFGACVVLRYPSMEIVDRITSVMPLSFPYVPGLLSFREGPTILDLVSKLKHEPGVLFFDGQGLAHPRGLGLASHLGLLLGRVSVGVGKSRLFGEVPREPGETKGSTAPLLHPDGHEIGRLLRTREGVKPVYVSVGHGLDLDAACELALACAPRYRIPEPTRQADKLAAVAKREWLEANPS